MFYQIRTCIILLRLLTVLPTICPERGNLATEMGSETAPEMLGFSTLQTKISKNVSEMGVEMGVEMGCETDV